MRRWLAIGIDPGTCGAVAALNERGIVAVACLDTGDTHLLRYFFKRIKAREYVSVAVGLERVSPHRKQGLTSVWTFAGSFWKPKAFLELGRWSHDTVLPKEWNSELIRRKPANYSRDKFKRMLTTAARDRWPRCEAWKWKNKAKQSAVADALGIAYYIRVNHFPAHLDVTRP